MLLGAPGTGKTRLQSRYTLRQFVDIEPQKAHAMGGHKHLRLADGTDVHLIIHELRTGRGRGTMDSFTHEDKYQEDCQRKRLLEQSDAVMLVFNPWSKASYEWINGKIIEDILYTGRKKQLTSDIVRLLDGLAAAMPKRTMSTRSALSFNSLKKKLPRRPDEPDSDSEASLFSNNDEKHGEDVIDYRGELKRISIVVEGSALKKAQFMIHEKDLPSPPLQSPTPSPLAVVTPDARRSRILPTIREVDESLRRKQRVAVMVDRRHLPIMKHDSIISLQSDSSRSSDYSETASTAIGTNIASEPSDTTHPLLRESNPVSDTVFDEAPERPGYRRSLIRTPTEETEVPVLVVATMTDRLKDMGGTLDRYIAPHQGQRLARKFGPNCAYIETSAKTNANVDEAYGIIVDQVMAKRAAARRDELARARIEAAIAAVQAEPRSVTRMAGPGRSCMPQWTWLDGLLERIPSWETVSEKFSRAFGSAGGGGEQSGDESAAGVVEDVWGEEVVKNPPKAHHLEDGKRASRRHSKGLSAMSDSQRLSEQMSEKTRSGMGNRTMSHDPKRDTSLNTVIEEMSGQGAMSVMPADMARRASQEWVIMPERSDSSYNPFEKDEFKRPMNMVTVTTLDPPKPVKETKQTRRRADILENLKRKPSLKGVRATNTILEGGLDLTRKGSMSLRKAVSKKGRKPDLTVATPTKAYAAADLHQIPDLFRKSRSSLQSRPSTEMTQQKRKSARSSHVSYVSEQAPSIPPLAFDAIIVDDRRASVSVLVRPADQERNDETIEQFLTQDATRHSMVMMLSPTTATRTLSAFVKEINSARAGGVTNTAVMVPEPPAKESRRVSEGVPELAPLPGVESEIEKRVKRITSPEMPSFQLPTSADDYDEFRTVMAPGMADTAIVEEPSLAAIVEEPFTAASVEQPSLAAAAAVEEPSAPVSVHKALPTLPPAPPPSLKTGPTPPQKKSPPPPTPAPAADKHSTSALPPIPETLPAVPAAVHITSKKHDSLPGPIITTTEVHGSDSSEDEKKQQQQQQQQQQPKRLRTPPNSRRARPRPRDSKGLMMAPPARPRRPDNRPDSRPLSAWI